MNLYEIDFLITKKKYSSKKKVHFSYHIYLRIQNRKQYYPFK